MRDLFLKYFSRILAVLGCTTLVTACYGVPYDSFHAKVSGKVVDEETGEPIPGISVKLTGGILAPGVGSGDVKGIEPVGDLYGIETVTDVHGAFSVKLNSSVGWPDAVLVECIDVDGEDNGSYLPDSEFVKVEDGASVSAIVGLERHKL